MYRRPNQTGSPGWYTHEASSKIVAVAVSHLLVVDVELGELVFFGVLKVDDDVEVPFVGDVGQHGVEHCCLVPSVVHLVQRHLRHLLHGCVVCAGHVRKYGVLCLVFDVDIHGQHVSYIFI